MKDKKFDFFDTIIVRTPTKNESFLNECIDEESILHAANEIKKHIFISSPDLFYLLEDFDKLTKSKKENVLVSLYKYIVRTSTRPTPYGLFAGLFATKWDKFQSNKNSEIDLNYKVFTSFDFEILYSIYKNNNQINYQTKYYLNDTLSCKNNKVKIIAFNDNVNGSREYFFTEYNLNTPLNTILSFFEKEKTLSFKEIHRRLTELGTDSIETEDFIKLLIEAKILLSNSELIHNNVSFYDRIVDSVLPDKKKFQLLQSFYSFKENEFDLKNMISLRKSCSKFLNIPNLKNILKVDLIGFENNDNLPTIPDLFKKELEHGIRLYLKLKLFKNNDRISNFIESFIQRYQYRAIPIMDVLDPYCGLNYLEDLTSEENPLTTDIPFFKLRNEHYDETSFFLFEKIKDKNCKIKEVNILDDEIAALDIDMDKIADTFNVMFRVIDVKRKDLYIDAIGSHAIKPISRFNYGNKMLTKLSSEVTDFEDEIAKGRNQIAAEIVHIPDRIRASNLIDNSNLRNFRIPIIYPDDYNQSSILLKDILVTVRNGKIILFCNVNQKEIIPHFSSMVIPENVSNLPLYRFLLDLNAEKKNYLFSWQNIPYAMQQTYIPRLRYKNIIVSPRLWNISRSEIENIKEPYNRIETLNAINMLRSKLDMPSKIVIKEHDNELLLDLTNYYSITIFCSEVYKRGVLTVAECLHGENSLFTDKNKAPINSQLIAFLRKTDISIEEEKSNLAGTSVYSEDNISITRTFYPGSKWIYYKIYCPVTKTDDLLIEIGDRIISYLKNQSLIKRWFFIRYFENGSHIRLRILASEDKFVYNITTYINEILSTIEMIDRVEIGTYNREIERYGMDCIVNSEKIFYHDSEFITSFLNLIQKSTDENTRWLYALKSIDSIFRLFCGTTENCIKTLAPLREEFNQEFNANTIILKTINNKYRQYRQKIDALFAGEYLCSEISNILNKRDENIYDIVNIMVKDSENLNVLVQSHVHMALNRCFSNNQRKNEMVLYNLLYSHYMKEIKIRNSMSSN